MNLRSATYLLSLLFLLQGCQVKEEKHSALATDIRQIVISNERPENISSDLSDQINLTTITLDAAVTEAVSSPISDFILIGEDLLAINRRNNILALLSDEGKINWKIPNQGQGREFPVQLDVVNYNPFRRTIELSDHSNHALFVYDLTGAFVEKSFSTIDFTDRIAIDKGSYLYDTHPYVNDTDESGQSYAFAVGSEEKYRWLKRIEDPRTDQPTFTLHNYFNRINDVVLYHRPFTDTTFVYSNGMVKPHHITKFVSGASRQDISDDPNIMSKVSEIIRQEAAFFRGELLTDSFHYSIYSSPQKRLFSVVDNKGNQIANSKFIRIGDTVIRCPYQATDSSFFASMKLAEVEFAQKHINMIDSDPAALAAELDAIREAEGDQGAEVVYVLMPVK